MRRTKSAEDRVRDLHSLLLQKTQDLDSALEVGRKLRREYHSTRQDAEGMLQVCPPPRHLLFLSWPLHVPFTTYTAMQRFIPSVATRVPARVDLLVSNCSFISCLYCVTNDVHADANLSPSPKDPCIFVEL